LLEKTTRGETALESFDPCSTRYLQDAEKVWKEGRRRRENREGGIENEGGERCECEAGKRERVWGATGDRRRGESEGVRGEREE
jgi:hypothetical protein